MAKVKMDAEMLAFASDVTESIRQAKRGEFAAVHTPEMIEGYKTRGRPVGTRVNPGQFGTKNSRLMLAPISFTRSKNCVR